MFPLILLAALAGTVLFLSKKGELREIKTAPGDIFRIRVRVPAVQDRSNIEAMYRVAMAQVGQIGVVAWEGDTMIVQVQYLIPSTITLGEIRAGTTTITVASAELIGRGTPPILSMAPGPMTPQAAATVGAVARKALQSGDPADLMGAAAVAEKYGAKRLSRALARGAVSMYGYPVRA